MSKLAYEIKKLECLPFDRRVVERNLTSGSVTRKAYDKHVKGLKDLVNDSEEFQATFGPEEDEAQTEDSTDGEAAEDEAASA